jgi:hypothetical protein
MRINADFQTQKAQKFLKDYYNASIWMERGLNGCFAARINADF